MGFMTSLITGTAKVGTHAVYALKGAVTPISTGIDEFKKGNVGRGLLSILLPGIGSAIVESTDVLPSAIDSGVDILADSEEMAVLESEYWDKVGQIGSSIIDSLAEKYGVSDLLPDDGSASVPEEQISSIVPAIGVLGSIALIARFLL